jgi:hypothetical protein
MIEGTVQRIRLKSGKYWNERIQEICLTCFLSKLKLMLAKYLELVWMRRIMGMILDLIWKISLIWMRMDNRIGR